MIARDVLNRLVVEHSLNTTENQRSNLPGGDFLVVYLCTNLNLFTCFAEILNIV
jgi:hypothetical protein